MHPRPERPDDGVLYHLIHDHDKALTCEHQPDSITLEFPLPERFLKLSDTRSLIRHGSHFDV
jgi:hypothetical protein